ncbi:TetR/AcrR family transcriptional regulator [Streptomyces sp. SPB074]|uniref:TetR/AcrR family transcriptional regulator n=1 Tax=Streptomyces sp. (strain SPB074) TaxID=465543 RepID=UPI0001D1E2D0|nr:TetR/AcrR family transcriptional regulator [Streptomyces sp. SPB074]EFG64793.1 TetR-family transcriptional regulator [Streptomyces sp. SPB074]
MSAVRAAVVEFAERGYEGTSTESIAQRVGVSQPYLFRLFKNKRELFLAAAAHSLHEAVRVFEEAADGAGDEGPKAAMGLAYKQLIERRPEFPLMFLRIYGQAVAARGAGDEEFCAELRRHWTGLWDFLLLRLGGDAEEAAQFMAMGMMINTLVSLGFPPGHHVWCGFDQKDVPMARQFQE